MNTHKFANQCGISIRKDVYAYCHLNKPYVSVSKYVAEKDGVYEESHCENEAVMRLANRLKIKTSKVVF